MSTQKIFIAVAGNIGSGKTTLTRMLSGRFGWDPHFEPVGDNPYLSDFYQDMEKWAFPLQIYFLTHRFKSHRTITEGGKSAIQDRSIYEDAHIFARNLYEQKLMSERDYQNYFSLYRCMSESLSPPDLVIYLKKSLPELKRGIARRGREFEANIPDQYLIDLSRYYDDWLGEYDLGKKLVIESDDFDFVNRSEDFDEISQIILDSLGQEDLFLSSGLKTKTGARFVAQSL